MRPRKIKLTAAYDGANFHGWQVQPGLRTVQAVMQDNIRKLTGDDSARVHGASRTDAGVSALGQVIYVIARTEIPLENIAKAINDHLPRDIVVFDAEEPGDSFDVVGGVSSKLYRYTIHTGRVRPVLQIRHCWHLPVRLDTGAMSAATNHIVGTKDFKSFASAADSRENSVRTVFGCELKSDEDWLYIDVEGSGFLYNMVRNIVGTLVDVGKSKISADEIPGIIQARDRQAAGDKAPAAGLCLMWIRY